MPRVVLFATLGLGDRDGRVRSNAARGAAKRGWIGNANAEFPARAVTSPRCRYDGAYVPPRCCPGPAVRLGLASTSDLTLPSVR